MYNQLYEFMKKKAKHTVWVFSDLQQSLFENTKKCLDICMEDYRMLGCPAEAIWYLGDSTEGTDIKELPRMVKLQEDAFSSLKIPLYYATGNHDYDYSFEAKKTGARVQMPFYEMVQQHPGWYTTKSREDTYFTGNIGSYQVFFFCDHIANDNSWLSTHNQVRYGEEVYPYRLSYWKELREKIAAAGPHVITASHYAFPGGNRDALLLGKMQPLPNNIRLHLYGHAHMGDYRCVMQNVFRRISWVDYQDIAQVDVASFENIRGSHCNSVLLQIYEDDTIGLFFRNHDLHTFTEAYFPAYESTEPDGGYEKWAPEKEDIYKKWLI